MPFSLTKIQDLSNVVVEEADMSDAELIDCHKISSRQMVDKYAAVRTMETDSGQIEYIAFNYTSGFEPSEQYFVIQKCCTQETVDQFNTEHSLTFTLTQVSITDSDTSEVHTFKVYKKD